MTQGVPVNIVSRTLLCTVDQKWGTYGTSVLVDRNNKRYLVTAAHLVAGINANPVMFFGVQSGKRLESVPAPVNIVGIDQNRDIAVLSVEVPLLTGPLHPVNYGLYGVPMGQEVYCLGYPQISRMDAPFMIGPTPVITRGVLSGLGFGHDGHLLVDVHASAGMSGGPIASPPFGGREHWTLLGVTSKAPAEHRQLENGHRVTWPQGFTHGVDIAVAEAMIVRNPIGPTITAES